MQGSEWNVVILCDVGGYIAVDSPMGDHAISRRRSWDQVVPVRTAIRRLWWFCDDAAYRAMDFLLDALGEIAAAIFDSVAHPAEPGRGHCLRRHHLHLLGGRSCPTNRPTCSPNPKVDDGTAKPAEYGARRFGKSKDHRDDRPQVVIAIAVTRDGIPVRCWTFPGQ